MCYVGKKLWIDVFLKTTKKSKRDLQLYLCKITVDVKATELSTKKIAPTESELKRVIEKKIDTERLSLVRDIFVFSCYTGLAYADVKNLKRSDIKTGINEKEWIFVNRQKTNSASHLPLLAQARMILARYRYHSKALTQMPRFPF